MPAPIHSSMTTVGRPAAITRWFMVAGSIGVALFAVGMAWLLDAFIESRLLHRDAELSGDFVQSIADTQKVAEVFRQPQGASDPAFVEFLAHIAAMPDVVRINVYTTGQRVLWSSSPGLIGQTFGHNDELEEALAGQIVASFDADSDKSEHVLLGSPREFVENYLPVHAAGGGPIVGVIELYRRPVALTQALAEGQRRIWGAAVLGGSLLILSLLWFVRRIERALGEQQRRLVDNEALAMVGELSAAVAHNIRNPLGSIRSAAELTRELGSAAPLDHEEVIRHVDRIEHLVRTLLTSAGDPTGRPHRCAVRPVLEAARARIAADLAAQHKQFSHDWPEALGEVALDDILLTQSLASVLANAAEATRSGDQVSLRASQGNGELHIVVEDSGAGLPLAGRDKLLQPFFTTKPRGLGLGLPLARRAMERAGGRLQIEPAHPHGTRVTLTLPLLPEHHA
ncbi:MAG: HAMP domain-containing histidine kinase [Burkholderiales bacterium]|nr:HAMP domain-containing histidine kinase [Burkholderiales bacterium]